MAQNVKQKAAEWIGLEQEAINRIKDTSRQAAKSAEKFARSKKGQEDDNRWYSFIMEEIDNALLPLKKASSSFTDLIGSSKPAERSTLRHWYTDHNWRTYQDEYIVFVDLPGIPQQDIKIKVTQDRIFIKADHSTCLKKPHKEEDPKSKHSNNLHIDRHYDKTLNIPSDINTEKIAAFYKDGVLIIQFPKKVIQAKDLPVKSYEQGLADRLKEKLGMA